MESDGPGRVRVILGYNGSPAHFADKFLSGVQKGPVAPLLTESSVNLGRVLTSFGNKIPLSMIDCFRKANQSRITEN